MRRSLPDRAQAPGLTWRLRDCLLALVLVTLLPAMGVAVYATWRSSQSYEAASAMRINDAVRILARAVEGDLRGRLRLMNTLASAPGADGMTLGELQAWVERSDPSVGSTLVLESLAPQAGSTAVGLPRAVADQAVGGRQAVLSNLLQAPDAAQAMAAIVVPMPSREQAVRLLTLLMLPQQLLTVATQRRDTGDSLLVAVTDGTGRIVARSRDIERFAGQRVPDWDKLVALGTEEGLFHARSKEGGVVVLGFRKLAGTPGWTVVVGEPLEAFSASARSISRQMLIGGGAVLCLSCLVALWLARQLERPVQRLMSNAHAVLRGGAGPAEATAEVRPARLHVAEFQSLAASIDAAEVTLRQRAEEAQRHAQALADSERRYRRLAESGSVVLWRADAQGQVIDVKGWAALTGMPDEQARGLAWLSAVHADDVTLLRQPFGEGRGSRDGLDVEVRLRLSDGRWHWVRLRGAAVAAANGAGQEWVGVLEDIDDRRQAEQKMAHMALHDVLTGLPNRVRFREQLEVAVQRAARGHQGAVHYIDLDRFKQVNDALGHAAGDALLQAMARRLQRLVREGDLAARLGGDEFAIVQADVASPRDASQLAARVVEAVSAPYEVHGQPVSIGASVGVMLVGAGAQDADALLRHADAALYRAKREGRGRHCFFDPQHDVVTRRLRRLEQDLAAALAADSLVLLYEPMVRPGEAGPVGYEAVLHWQHGTLGEQDEETVQRLAEHLGASDVLADWMIRRACRDASAWPDGARVAVSLTAVQWLAPTLAARLADILGTTGLDPARLELEVREAALQACDAALVQALRDVRALGVRLVLDRFASPASALGLLGDLPFDKVKLDGQAARRAAEQPMAAVMVSGLMQLCRRMGLRVGARGVDTPRQQAALAAAGDDELQGRVFGGPLTAQAMADHDD